MRHSSTKSVLAVAHIQGLHQDVVPAAGKPGVEVPCYSVMIDGQFYEILADDYARIEAALNSGAMTVSLSTMAMLAESWATRR